MAEGLEDVRKEETAGFRQHEAVNPQELLRSKLMGRWFGG